jgi:hypothetical protein
MVKRKKRLEKQIKGLEKQKDIHKGKIKFEKRMSEGIMDYWEKEVVGFDEQIKKKEELLKKIGKK